MATIQTTLGPVSGFVDTHVISDKSTADQPKSNQKPVVKYLGLPYGEAGRWEQARPHMQWSATKACLEYGPATPQLPAVMGQRMAKVDGFLKRLHLGISEKDIYTLNIYTPDGAKEGDDLPVMVWLYGGSWKDGSASAMIYDATNVIRDASQPVIIVTVNYRTNIFGFLATEDLRDNDGLVGNYGLRDQLLGLKFVKDNIRKFGGDAGNVTIYGESAGAASVVYHCVGRDAIFKRAIAQSGGTGTMSFLNIRDHEALWNLILKSFGIVSEDKAERVRRAKEIPMKHLLGFLHKMPGLIFSACQEQGPNAIWTEHPAAKFDRGETVPSLESFMAGVCTDEGLIFAQLFGMHDDQSRIDSFVKKHGAAAAYYPHVYANIGDAKQHKGDLESHPASRMIHNELFEGPVVFDIERLSKAGKVKCFLYRSNAILPSWREFGWGVHHASELPLVFKTAGLWRNDANAEEARTAQDYVDKWVAFAARGEPANTQVWPQYSASNRQRYVFEMGGSSASHLEEVDISPAMQLHEGVIKAVAGIQSGSKL
ncbi:Alpha/Beta hydrolase protein [Protomyces lactucae-debilis]|uniref:Carboxylic ester hydrolase n=1 Tax=Protomyces lactucae-debilis TaxID=2754530 RepID=A0A1Y2F4S0_PROLT|nr:Alpha/Beta hydrolase protein [Protomyces lactucae-debilis]ORY78667.1 Alpha/Beta hydrolase protein [Protomyces lactucae-debilis]